MILLEYEVVYENVDLRIKTEGELKICGMWYCNRLDQDYRCNIMKKVVRLMHNIRLWNSRNLTSGGKVLIVKSFGISQLIYILKVCKLR